jgi:CelD/BcsL family acetyltransferase involved in cellulose biosynthesis
MPLYATNFADSATKANIETLFELTGTQEKKVDLLAFERQPLQWRTIKNPLSLLPKQASINTCPLLDLVPHTTPEKRISNSFRRRLRGKERKLQPLPGYGYRIAQTDDDIRRTLRTFFMMKRQRMAAQKLPDVFSEPGVEDFIVAACLAKISDGRRGIEIHILDCADELIAIFAGIADGHRFSMMFNTYTISDNAKYSPGLILLRDIIDHYATANYTSLDLGIGADDYKKLFCKDDEALFDSFIPLSMRGNLTALGLSSVTHAKRLVKQTPALAQMAQLLRGALRR